MQVTLVLTESDYSLKMWPHKFKVAYSVALHGEPLGGAAARKREGAARMACSGGTAAYRQAQLQQQQQGSATAPSIQQCHAVPATQ